MNQKLNINYHSPGNLSFINNIGAHIDFSFAIMVVEVGFSAIVGFHITGKASEKPGILNGNRLILQGLPVTVIKNLYCKHSNSVIENEYGR